MNGRNISVRNALDNDAVAWNNFLDRTPNTSPLARYEWSSILQDSYGIDTHFIIAELAGEVVGVLGGYHIRDLFGQRIFFSTRHGFVAPEKAAVHALFNNVEETQLSEANSKVLMTSGCYSLAGVSPSSIKKTVELSINPDENELWKGLRSKTRNIIRRAKRDGITVVSGHDYLEPFFDHYVCNMLRLGVTIHSRKFFSEVIKNLGSQTEILVALYKGQPIASMMVHFGQDIACYPYQNTIYEYRHLAPIQILNWKAMKLCRERGVRILDMGESSENSPVYKSKINFGGTPNDVFYFEKISKSVDSSNSESKVLTQMKRVAAVADSFLIRHAPPWLRRYVAHRQLIRNRVL